MTHPDPVRASFEAWRAHEGAHIWDEQGCIEHALAAYRAASKVSELERAVVEAVMDQDGWDGLDPELPQARGWNEPFRRVLRARNALRSHRTPPKVDRVKAARDKVREIGDLLTAELEARSNA